MKNTLPSRSRSGAHPSNQARSTQRSRKSPLKRLRESGQVLVIIMAFSAILGAALLSIYNTAILSAEKRELINAADASAYSGAAILAQGLNYTAYTNRAILANNVLIGQMTAISSTLSMSEWYWKNTGTMLRLINSLTRYIPYIGAVISAVTTATFKFANIWGDKILHPIKVLTKVLQASGTAAVSLTNHALWLSQQVHMADSILGFEPNMIAIAKDNAPDASVDGLLHGTAFGPLVTLGSFASKFTIKVRKGKKTVGTRLDAEKDEYLNYITETNRGVGTPAYVGGRNLIPNAMGLWIATGCDLSPSSLVTSATSSLFTPAAGFGSPFDTIIQVLDIFGGILSPIANPIMCMFDRHGGTELVQNEDGKFSWVSIDATAFSFKPLRGILPGIPLAGGSVASFVNPREYRRRRPDSISNFIDDIKDRGDQMAQNAAGNAKKKYFGHQVELKPDCVEYLSPGTWHHYAVSTNTKVTGTCAVLSTGVGVQYVNKGLFGGDLADTADKVMDSRRSSDSTAAALADAAIGGVADAASSAVSSALSTMNPPSIPSIPGPSTSAAPGISGEASATTITRPDTAAMSSAGSSLSGWASLATAAGVSTLTSALNPANFRINPGAIIASAGLAPGGGTDGGPGFWTRLALKALLGAVLDTDALIDLMSLKISHGIERPPSAGLNRAFHILADGLPPFFWDVKVKEDNQTASKSNFGEKEDLVFTDDEPQDYHDRRYNLGPLVYLPLIKSPTKTKTTQNMQIGGKLMGLADYRGTRDGLKAIGKARIFFREPADHWLGRYKTIKTSSLILPYWQVRNESLSYVDKAALIAIEALTP